MYALTQEQIDQVSGAVDWNEVGIGVGIAVAGATFVVATGGAGLPITLVAMAGTSEMIMGGAVALGLGALGGYAVGEGFMN